MLSAVFLWELLMKACVFVDGENFRHSIKRVFQDTFEQKDYLPKNARWSDLFDSIVARASNGEAKRLRAYWYVIDSLDPWPRKLPPLSEAGEWVGRHKELIEKGRPMRGTPLASLSAAEIIKELSRRRDAKYKRFAGFRRVQRGIAHTHGAVEFRRSGAITHDLFSDMLGREKTVDVNLAVDMLQLRDIYDLAIVVSGDQDHLPAVQAVKNAGKTVVNVAFTDAEGNMLPGGAKQLNEAADRPLIIDYATFADFLGLSARKGGEK